MSAGRRLPGAPAPMHRFEGSGGVTIAGDSFGDPGGPLVVLLHGGGQTRFAWKGAGESPAALGEGHVDATALVLVDIAPRIERAGTAKIQAFMSQKPEGFASLEEVAEAIASYQPHRKRPTSLDGLAKNVRLGEDGRYRWHWDPKFRAGARDLAMREARPEACARNLTLPTLLVRGGLSDVLSEAGAQQFLALCPRSEYVNISSAGHMVAGDRNDVFAGAVVEFLGRTVPIGGEPVHAPYGTHPHHEGPPGDVDDVP